MIQLTRSLCRQLRVVIKKAFGRHKPQLRVMTGPDGLRVQAKGHQHALEYHDPEPREPAELVMPFAVLEDVQGTKNEPVRLHCPKKKVLAVTWQDRGVERTMQYTLPKDDNTAFPVSPTSFTENSSALLKALQDASETTDSTSSRYALACIQLRGSTGAMAATDGRQLLLQTGFTFGFQEDVLAHCCDVFGCAELPQNQPVFIGKTDKDVVVRVGNWAFFLALGNGQFPRVHEIIPSCQNATTTLEMHPDDAQFFVENASRLPGNVGDQGITLDLNGSVCVRAKTDDSQPAEIVLRNSSIIGKDETACLNRLNLVRAARMNFHRLYVFGSGSPVLARDDSRSYLFMPLEVQQAIKPSADCLRIESPFSARPNAPIPRYHSPTVPMRKPSTTVPATVDTPIPSPSPAREVPTSDQPIRRRRRKSTTGGSVLEQAIAVREQLRVSLAATKDLIRTLKAERRSQKSIKLALDSLKQLQAVA